MTTTNIVHLIGRELGLALAPLQDALASPAAFEALMRELGWSVEDIPAPIQDLAASVDRLNSALVPVLAGDGSPSDFLELLQGIRTLIDGIEGLRDATFDARLAAAGFAARFPGQLVEHLFVQHLVRERPRVAFLLSVLGIIRSTYVEAASPEHHDQVRRELVWADFPGLLRDPVQLLENAFGWRTDHLAHEILLRAATNLALSTGLRASLEEIDGKLIELLENQPPAPGKPTQFGVNLALFQRMGAVGEVAAGLKLLGLRRDGPLLPGFALLPYLTGQLGDDVTVDSRRTLSVKSTLDLAGGVGIVLRPDTGLRVMGGLGDLEGSTLAEGRVLLKLVDRDRSGDPTVLIGTEDGSRLEYKTLSVTAGLLLEAGGESDLFAELQLEEARLVVKPGQGDGFLRSILPADGITAEFELAPGLSRRQGFYFRGSGGLATEIPVNRSFGTVRLQSVTLAVHLASGEPTIPISLGVMVAAELGPVTAVVNDLGVKATFSFPGDTSGVLGPLDLTVGFKPPTGVGLVVEAPAVTGGGFLFFDPAKAEYGGVLQLELAETIAVKAIGLLTTRLPDGGTGFSLVIIMTAEGFAPIQLGFGFTLTGIGGLLGINRTVLVDVLRSGLKHGTLGSILFPADPIRNAPQIVSDLRAVFPPVKGRHVFGPMAIIAWGTPTILTLQLGLLLELPDPVRLIILGRLQAMLPDEGHALVQIRMDALGVIDFNKSEASLDATLYDSRVLEFALTGDMALRANWGPQPSFVLALGGFHPRFTAPAGFPALDRLALSLADGDALRLRCEAYLALTSNTVQFGARLDLHAAGGGFSFDGMLGFDALFQLTPFAFVVDIAAALALRYHGHLLVGVFFSGSLSGPTPWHVDGKATIKILFFKVSVHFDHQFGEPEPPALPEAVDVVGRVVAALGDRRNWSAAVPRGEPPVVTLRDRPATAASLVVHPLAELTVRERIVPLNRAITSVGSAPVLGGTTTVTVAATGVGATAVPITATPVREPFALAQYQEMSDDEKLARPAFEALEAGLQFGLQAVAYEYEALTDSTIAYETLLIDPPRPADAEPAAYVLPGPVLDAVVSLGAAGQAAFRRRGVNRYRELQRAA